MTAQDNKLRLKKIFHEVADKHALPLMQTYQDIKKTGFKDIMGTEEMQNEDSARKAAPHIVSEIFIAVEDVTMGTFTNTFSGAVKAINSEDQAIICLKKLALAKEMFSLDQQEKYTIDQHCANTPVKTELLNKGIEELKAQLKNVTDDLIDALSDDIRDRFPSLKVSSPRSSAKACGPSPLST